MTDAEQQRFGEYLMDAFEIYKREMIAERVKAGIAEARQNGEHFGRPSIVWDRKEAARLRAGGASLRKISALLGVPVTSLRRGLKREAL